MTAACDRFIDIRAAMERVWQLVSTSEGLSGWFVDATVVPGPQGTVTLRFAPGAQATSTTWTGSPCRPGTTQGS